MVDITAPVEAKLFGKWSMDDLMCNEISLDDYIATKEVYTPHTGQRYQARKFRKFIYGTRTQALAWAIIIGALGLGLFGVGCYGLFAGGAKVAPG